MRFSPSRNIHGNSICVHRFGTICDWTSILPIVETSHFMWCIWLLECFSLSLGVLYIPQARLEKGSIKFPDMKPKPRASKIFSRPVINKLMVINRRHIFWALLRHYILRHYLNTDFFWMKAPMMSFSPVTDAQWSTLFVFCDVYNSCFLRLSCPFVLIGSRIHALTTQRRGLATCRIQQKSHFSHISLIVMERNRRKLVTVRGYLLQRWGRIFPTCVEILKSQRIKPIRHFLLSAYICVSSRNYRGHFSQWIASFVLSEYCYKVYGVTLQRFLQIYLEFVFVHLTILKACHKCCTMSVSVSPKLAGYLPCRQMRGEAFTILALFSFALSQCVEFPFYC